MKVPVTPRVCAVCSRQTRGFGWFNPKLPRSHPKRADSYRKFCSLRCQGAYSNLMKKTGGKMIDPTEMEIAAMTDCLDPLGDYVAALGLDTPLAGYSRDQVLGLIEVVVTTYQDRMVAGHEAQAGVPF
ncbi:MAG: DUF6511 domain-containing protein [Nitrospirota bacterium]|nr:DUF6511 domain-containing protein [Nitrospirota bacterium]